jgi:hypothetical protein
VSCPRGAGGGGGRWLSETKLRCPSGKGIGRTVARGCGGAKGGVSTGGAAAEEWDDGELELAGVRVEMAAAFL